MSKAFLNVIGLNKSFDNKPALKSIDINVEVGEFVILLGRSGSGKSTLLRHLNGLEKSDSGYVEVFGTKVGVSKKSLLDLRKRIGFIFQKFELVGPLSVLENVLCGALGELRLPRLGLITYPKALKIRALALLQEVGMREFSYSRADQLSGGQQQRVAIARALMQNPDILLADEPVASLDPENSRQVMQLIKDLANKHNITVICSLHQVDLALKWGTRIIGLRGGEIVIDKPSKSLDVDYLMQLYTDTKTATKEIQTFSQNFSADKHNKIALIEE